MTALFKNWSIFRGVRLVAGIGALAYGIVIADWLFVMVGIALGMMAILNAGCSPFSKSCDIDIKEKNEQ